MPTTASDALQSALADFLETYWRLHPVEATQAGVRHYDAALPDWSDAGLAERHDWLRASRSALEGIPDDTLGLADRLDRRVALAEIAGLEVQDEWGWKHAAPGFYVEQALGGLNTLVARPTTDPALSERDRADVLRARLAAIPTLLAQGQSVLDPSRVAPELVEIARVACRGARAFLEAFEAPLADAGRRAALAAVDQYAAFIEGITPRGTFATGPDLFERLLREKHGLDLTPDELARYGADLTDDLQARLDDTARAIDASRPWHVQVEALKQDHPTRHALLPAYADEAARARAFVEANNLVSIPPGEQLQVRPTPPFQRATSPLGHFDKAPPFAPADNLGILYITPIPEDAAPDREEALLQGHCWTAVRAICLHETFPGHHLQLWHAKLQATPVRRQFHSTLFAEGWGLYCEELMEEAGYYDTPALTLWRLKNALWRAVRIQIDAGLHTGRLTLDQAAHLLEERGGLEPATARGEVLRYTTSPTQPSSYVLGRDGIMALRRRQQRIEGPAFTPRAFHDRLLAYSSVSPAFIPEDMPRLGESGLA